MILLLKMIKNWLETPCLQLRWSMNNTTLGITLWFRCEVLSSAPPCSWHTAVQSWALLVVKYDPPCNGSSTVYITLPFVCVSQICCRGQESKIKDFTYVPAGNNSQVVTQIRDGHTFSRQCKKGNTIYIRDGEWRKGKEILTSQMTVSFRA